MEIVCDRDQVYPAALRRMALLCIDYQRDFISADGMCASRGLPVQKLASAIEPARRALAAAREKGMTVVHLREAYSPDLSDLNVFRRERDSIVGVAGPLGRFLIRGEPGTRTVAELAPRPGEAEFDKPGFSGFHGTGLHDWLQARGITHLVMMGITTQCCVASTLRAAVDLGYFPLLLADACAAYEPAHHAAVIEEIFSENHQFGWVSDSRRLIAALTS